MQARVTLLSGKRARKTLAALAAAIYTSAVAAAVPTACYDFSDFNGMYQDNLGTIPVTAVEQPIGLILDKSRNFVRGIEAWVAPMAVVNANWTDNGGGVFTSNGTNGFLGWASGKLGAGRTYEGTLRVVSRTAGSVNLPYDGAGGNQRGVSAPGTYRWIFTATANGLYIYSNIFAGVVDSISLREIPGNHASQPTSTARPIVDARINKSLNFNANPTDLTGVSLSGDAAALLSVVDDTAALAAAGLSSIATSGKVYKLDNSAGASGANLVINGTVGTLNIHTTSAYIRGTGQGAIRLSGTGFTAATLTAGYARVTNSQTPTSTGQTLVVTAQPAAVIYVVLNQLEENATAWPTVQVVTGSTYDATGFPITARFDGIDDALITNTIAMSTTDKLTCIVGLRKTRDAGPNVLMEYGPAPSPGGTFAVFAPLGAAPSNDLSWRAQGSAVQTVTVTARPAPYPYVFTGTLDIAGSSTLMRLNGLPSASSTASLGTGNLTNQVLYIGARQGTSLWAALKIARIDIIGKLLSPGDVYTLERLNRQQLTGVTL